MARIKSDLNVIDTWWLDQQTQAQIDIIRAQQETEKQALAQQAAQFNEVLSMYKTAFGEMGTDGGFSVPEAFKENIDLFAPGGQYGAGAKAEISKGAQEALAAGQIGLASTGMSSGTNVAGLQARVLADKALANAKIEDQRIANLSSALTTYGQAGLTEQQLKSQRDLALLNTLSNFRI
jgi:hypothetical protein